ncbi:MAG: hypothetical protein R2874_09885 [Desulfobacterales bacterium]
MRSEQKDVEKRIGNYEIDPSSFDQKDVISYIPTGGEASFAFKVHLPYFYTQSLDQKPEMPPEEELDVIIESFNGKLLMPTKAVSFYRQLRGKKTHEHH